MNKPCLYDIGFCFSFNVYVDDNKVKLDMIADSILSSKASAIMISDMFDLPFKMGNVSIFLYHTYSRKSYDLYHKFGGKDMRVMDPVTIQCLLMSLGVTSARKPSLFYLNTPDVMLREEIG